MQCSVNHGQGDYGTEIILTGAQWVVREKTSPAVVRNWYKQTSATSSKKQPGLAWVVGREEGEDNRGIIFNLS
jgi:hypothetical protein